MRTGLGALGGLAVGAAASAAAAATNRRAPAPDDAAGVGEPADAASGEGAGDLTTTESDG